MADRAAAFTPVPENEAPTAWRLREYELEENATMWTTHVSYDAKEKEFLEKAMTLRGELPWGNREVIAISYPYGREVGFGPEKRYDENAPRGYAYVRWCSRELAVRCHKLFHNTNYRGKALDANMADREMRIHAVHVGQAVKGQPRFFEECWPFPEKEIHV